MQLFKTRKVIAVAILHLQLRFCMVTVISKLSMDDHDRELYWPTWVNLMFL